MKKLTKAQLLEHIKDMQLRMDNHRDVLNQQRTIIRSQGENIKKLINAVNGLLQWRDGSTEETTSKP